MTLKQGISKKVIWLILFSMVLILLNSEVSYAYPKAEKHDKALMEVLFEEGYSKYQSTEIKEAIEAIMYASQLTIDQSRGSNKKNYYDLKNYVTRGMPRKFSDIDYMYDVDSGIEITPNTHRKYTHQGWNVVDKKGNAVVGTKAGIKFWKTRKKILLSTINEVFDFGVFSTPIHYDDKCDALCGVVYYVHILGDYDEADKISKLTRVIPLAGHKDTDQYDTITQLIKHLEILFEEQKDTSTYKSLMQEIEKIEKEAAKLERSVGGVNTEEEFEIYHQCAVDLLDTLKQYIPKLLKKERFFAEVFYPNEM
mgnify:CR=1 FL=1